MNRKLLGRLLLVRLAMCSTTGRAQQSSFTLDQVLSAPFNSGLVAAKAVNRLAWSVNQQGRRNIWVAEGESFTARQLTNYYGDDGVELSDLKFTPDGNAIVFVRGEGKNSAGEYANPTSNPTGPEQIVWTVPLIGGAPEKIDAGHSPCASVQGKIAYARDGQIYLGTVQGLVGK